ncbi:DUF2785 domain-containing protein [Sporosarcina sp. ANT_H38]|uniref:DUF2785 domain-containing protein n=1 Tax=Sporosarcina sp. ANT_H38 TaxID=2597358 RepID=UPI0011F304EA|nr:DUF2785 domain-containing protein [Sporosarcina sp. ANT_H38]KAA0964950.1 DUF2785 domain-containing protein [Sporosarcina sp. ANT_H38]
MLIATLESYLEDRMPKLTKEIRQEMLTQIGNPDSYLRDELIYRSFGKMIVSNQLNSEEIQALLEVVLQEDYLFYGIGESGTDSVFTRSFSALVIAAVIEYDIEKQVVDPDLVLYTVDRVIRYMMEEKDARGFIHGNGWAHAIAHGADALDALSKHPLLKKEDSNQILHAVQHSLLRQVDYLDEEEERLATIIVSLIKYQDNEQAIRVWIEELARMVETQMDENKGSLDAYHVQRTVKNFLKSVYVILSAKDIGKKVNSDVFGVLKKWMWFYLN